MNEIEKRARELLADGLRRSFPEDTARRLVIAQLLADELDQISARVAVKALAAALTPPEGYVLVPMSATERMRLAGWKVIDNKGDRAHQVWEAMLAARPEVSP